MPSSSSSYGQFNPNAVDPFQIESTLASIVGQNNPAAASQALDLYQMQNQNASNAYGAALGQQHDFAKQQLAAQIADNNAKHFTEFGKEGLLGLAAQSPEFSQSLGGIDPAALMQRQGQYDALQATNLAEKGFNALEHASTSGWNVPTGQAQGITGLSVAPGTERAVRIAGMNNAAHAATARRDDFSIPIRTGVDPNNGQPLYGQLKIPLNASPEVAQERVRRARGLLGEAETPGTNIPGGPTPGGTGPAKLDGATNLPPKPGATKPPDTPPGKVEDPRSVTGSKLQGLARQHLQRLPAEARKDVEAGTVNGLISLQNKGGRMHYVGKSGNTYTVAP